MAKQKERSELEVLRAENKNLKSMVKHLHKEVGRVNKRKNQYFDLEEKLVEDHLTSDFEEKEIVDNSSCPKCKKGKIEIIDLKIRKMKICNKCDYRLVTKNG